MTAASVSAASASISGTSPASERCARSRRAAVLARDRPAARWVGFVHADDGELALLPGALTLPRAERHRGAEANLVVWLGARIDHDGACDARRERARACAQDGARMPARVVAALGLEPRPPHPKGYEMGTDDLTLLDPVRRRGPRYRAL